jgi:hypothetical protein
MALVDQKGLCVGNKVAAGPLIRTHCLTQS